MARILLVEDAKDLAQVIERELEAAGYEVDCAGDGSMALDLHSRRRPDLVILDWMLPGLDGLEVLRRIRQTSVVPVLMLTARGEEIDRVIGLEVGADDYLAKPFSMRELLARVRALLRRISHVQQILAEDRRRDTASMRYAGLTLEPEAYRATLDGDALELTRTEFELLHFLLRNPGRAFSRAYLLDAVWGENYVTGDRSVDNAVLRLRRKLGDLGEAIETVWGVGYRLLPEELVMVRQDGDEG
ncbi:MAG TPA: response regulator transcription factor [Anaerolineae bacterium]|nr:response regulator transcription factor [Anaerolineae bacterium]